jgi:hypothetical protein
MTRRRGLLDTLGNVVIEMAQAVEEAGRKARVRAAAIDAEYRVLPEAPEPEYAITIDLPLPEPPEWLPDWLFPGPEPVTPCGEKDHAC